MKTFYKSRAEKLVTDSEIEAAGPAAPVLRPDEKLDDLFPEKLEIELPHYENFHDFVPKSKVSNSASPSTISSALLKEVWPELKFFLNSMSNSFDFEYPSKNQGYYQRTIKKKADINELKDLRPLGKSDDITKYFVNRPSFGQIRKHTDPLFDKRLNFSYRGCQPCIIMTIDQIHEHIVNRKPLIVIGPVGSGRVLKILTESVKI